jgi:hypothetical protein
MVWSHCLNVFIIKKVTDFDSFSLLARGIILTRMYLIFRQNFTPVKQIPLLIKESFWKCNRGDLMMTDVIPKE